MITDRKLDKVELLFSAATQLGLRPTWLVQDSLFVIPTAHGERYVNSTLNTNLSSRLTSNKNTTRVILERHGLPSMQYLNPSNLAEAEEFLATYKKIIVKPLTGTDSRDVHIVESPERLSSFKIDEYILEQYAPGKEMRYLILDDEVIGVHESQYGESVAQDRALRRISFPEAEWDTELTELSVQVAKIFGLRYAAVDYIVSPDGVASILEVNSSPGMKWFHAPTSGPGVDVARLFLEAMLDDVDSDVSPTPVELATSSVKVYT
jgi:glutathione synthase/RimK-type ligase-like ATP-grasp enzyme